MRDHRAVLVTAGVAELIAGGGERVDRRTRGRGAAITIHPLAVLGADDVWRQRFVGEPRELEHQRQRREDGQRRA